MDLTTTIATGAVIATVFNILQPIAEVPIPATAKLHDPLMRLVVLMIGALVGLIQFALGGAAVSLHAVTLAAFGGLQAGLSAIVVYHLVQGDGPLSTLVAKLTPPPPSSGSTGG